MVFKLRNLAFYILLTSLFFLNSCSEEKQVEKVQPVTNSVTTIGDTIHEPLVKSKNVLKDETAFNDTLENRLIAAGLVDVQSFNSNIIVDLKYASTDNFLEKNVYGSLSNAYLQKDVAVRLANVQSYLDENHPHLRLYVFDAVRPAFVQQLMWDALDTIPFQERIKFVSNPKNGSIHNYACAIDLSLFDTIQDTLLDMGAGFDDPRKIAYPKFEKMYLDSGLLTTHQINNRKLLRSAMRKGGFWVLPTEWWHFNAFTRADAKTKYTKIP